MHVVQTLIRRVVPLTVARTLWRFGNQRRRVRLWAWLMLLPLTGLFSQIWQTFDIVVRFQGWFNRNELPIYKKVPIAQIPPGHQRKK
jgi:hypothetical protein